MSKYGNPSCTNDPYPDTDSQATITEDPKMSTPWAAEVHELRDRVTGQPTRPRNYSEDEDYHRYLRGEYSRQQPATLPQKPNKTYAVLCCGSKAGVAIWAVAALGLAVVIAVLMVRALVSLCPSTDIAPSLFVSRSQTHYLLPQARHGALSVSNKFPL